MPYKVVEQKNAWAIKKKENGKWKVVGHSDTKKKAQASIRARHASENK